MAYSGLGLLPAFKKPTIAVLNEFSTFELVMPCQLHHSRLPIRGRKSRSCVVRSFIRTPFGRLKKRLKALVQLSML
jgi:hypothetical protein